MITAAAAAAAILHQVGGRWARKKHISRRHAGWLAPGWQLAKLLMQLSGEAGHGATSLPAWVLSQNDMEESDRERAVGG